MSEAVIVALITGAFAVVSSIVAAVITSNKTIHKMEIVQAVTNERIDELTRETRAHNNFAVRMPVVEAEIEELKRRIGEYHSH